MNLISKKIYKNVQNNNLIIVKKKRIKKQLILLTSKIKIEELKVNLLFLNYQLKELKNRRKIYKYGSQLVHKLWQMQKFIKRVKYLKFVYKALKLEGKFRFNK